MLFKNDAFKLVAEIIDGAPVPVAIAGGAVRDEVNDRLIKDFDILVHEDHVPAFNQYLQSVGLEIIATREDFEQYGQLPDDFDSRYIDWSKWADCEFGLFDLDVLVLGRDKYLPEDFGLNFIKAVHLFDNTMNMYLYTAGVIVYLGGKAEKKLAIQSREVSASREQHVKEIAEEIGWTYVPLAK